MKNNIQEYRKKRGYTQEQMAGLLSVSRQTYINYESGNAEPPFETLKLISKILRTPIDDLLGNDIYPSDRNTQQQQLIKEIETVLTKYK